ncbi:MAG TPA: MarR family transcriptional regulator [Myxococcaceae bacterium]
MVQVLRLGGLLTAVGDALSEPAGQSSARWQVLAAADHAPMTVAQVARALGLARQSVQRVADLLAKEGLAGYQDNPGHLRAKLLHLTPRGRAVLGQIQQAQRGWADELGAELGEADLRKASAVLGRVLEAVAGRQSGPG